MSHRAIQRLREERKPALPDCESDEDGEDDTHHRPVAGSFAMMFGDDSDSSGSDDEDDESDAKGKESEPVGIEKQGTDANNSPEGDTEPVLSGSRNKAKEEPSKVEDLDTLLEEFKLEDEEPLKQAALMDDNEASGEDIIIADMDIRDLDYDYVMRTSLFGTNEGPSRPNRRQTFLFGPPRNEWVRPPHYVGGGVGMATYEDDRHRRSLPWPYSGRGEAVNETQDRWFTFIHSDSYCRDCEDYERVKASGDPNAMVMFVAHHPYVTEALLQTSEVLYQINQRQEGFALLKRVLWIYECSALPSFSKVDRKSCFMDYQQPENFLFFLALFRLVRVSYVAGLTRVSLAASRFLLSLDPQRDPMGVLLALDHFALLANEDIHNAWLSHFVESQVVQIHYRDKDSAEEYSCELLDLPNWAFSYALALHRTNLTTPSPQIEQKAKTAIQGALSKFPGLLELLLIENEVDILGRSMQMDWPLVLEYTRNRSKALYSSWSQIGAIDTIVRSCTIQAYELIVKIFVKQNAKLWGRQDVLRWVYGCLFELITKDSLDPVIPLSPALIRYGTCDPSDYDDKFQTMPAEANPLDPGLVVHALAIDPNRPRFLQRMPREGLARGDHAFAAHPNHAGLAGPPTNIVDPDWPLIEVFWRSALPWNHVEGVPPPPR